VAGLPAQQPPRLINPGGPHKETALVNINQGGCLKPTASVNGLTEADDLRRPSINQGGCLMSPALVNSLTEAVGFRQPPRLIYD
jgi:hypothetical protein